MPFLRCLAALSLILVAGAAAAQEPPYGLTERVRVRALAFPSQPLGSGAVAYRRMFPAVSFDAPTAIAFIPGDDARMYVALRGGRILAVDNVPDAATAATFIDLRDRVTQDGGEMGLLGFAFDPDFAENGHFYVNYMPSSGSLRTVVSRFSTTGSPPRGVPDSELQLLSFSQPFTNHNGGALAFGPDRMLYIASGDGGSGGDPQNNGQNLGRVLGKILRIARDGSVPADNPFTGTASARGEIWAYGLRNPWRISFDRASGELWAGDVGQNAQEEVDIIRRGGNYGWRVYEGRASYNNPLGLPPDAFDQPVHVYTHADGFSITGGYVYRGSAIPALAGRYVYGDFGGRVWALTTLDGRFVDNEELPNRSSPSTFGEDNAGELYVASFDRSIHKLVAGTGGGAEFPQRLSDTGLFRNVARLRPSPGLIPYDVNAPLWSDGAEKQRWLALPRMRRIRFDDDRAWRFPPGTVLVKHFEMRLADGSDRRLETRVLILQDAGWQGYTYRWNEAGTDAFLIDGGETVELEVPAPGAPGGAQTISYQFPSRSACLGCHTAAAGYVLGLRTAQANRDFVYPAATDNQLRAMNHIALFDEDIGAPAALPRLPDPAGSAPLAVRARAYLEANCAQCHRPGGPTPSRMDLRASIPAGRMSAVGVEPAYGDLGLPQALLIDAGDRTRSVLWERMRRTDADRMPPLASHRVDDAGVALIGAWIDAGAP